MSVCVEGEKGENLGRLCADGSIVCGKQTFRSPSGFAGHVRALAGLGSKCNGFTEVMYRGETLADIRAACAARGSDRQSARAAPPLPVALQGSMGSALSIVSRLWLFQGP